MTDVYKEPDTVYRTLIDSELLYIDTLSDEEKFYLMLKLGVDDLSTWTITDKVYDFVRANGKLYAASYLDISYPRLRAFNNNGNWNVSAKPSEIVYPKVAIPVVRIPFCVKSEADMHVFGWEGYYDCE